MELDLSKLGYDILQTFSFLLESVGLYLIVVDIYFKNQINKAEKISVFIVQFLTGEKGRKLGIALTMVLSGISLIGLTLGIIINDPSFTIFIYPMLMFTYLVIIPTSIYKSVKWKFVDNQRLGIGFTLAISGFFGELIQVLHIFGIY